ncbi:MAG: hypothetical protein FJ148_10305 [Deltaproteobacteria bacterium]|nr:hypothetical protein [Deltaproteobacteria bacterium]
MFPTRYRQKRRFDTTSEPRGEDGAKRRGRRAARFVVHKHRASRLHYDLRLEADGVLHSWALPKGPSLDSSVKRLAMQVEDHPVDHASFEGTIPQSESGGGTMMLWDRGTWRPDEPDVAHAIEQGELKFSLAGEKLRGSWVLVRTGGRGGGRDDRTWLLIKHRDEAASEEDIGETQPCSVATCRLLAQIAHDEGGDVAHAASADPPAAVQRLIRALRVGNGATPPRSGIRETPAGRRRPTKGATRTARIPFRGVPMLATLSDRPFHRTGWVHEEKYDGYRILAYKEGAHATLLSRNAKDRTTSFAAIAADFGRLSPRTLLLDGEAVAFDEHLVSRFQLLQKGHGPIVFAAFDCLYLDGHDLRGEPLGVRRAALERAIAGAERIFPARRLAGNGIAALRIAKRRGFEGLVAKDASAPYVSGRSRRWLRVKVTQADEFVVVGYTRPTGARSRFGALLLGSFRDGAPLYVGKVGTGFSGERLESLWRRFRPLVRPSSALADPPRASGLTWLEPQLVAQVGYTEWTADRKLRQPVFLGLRDDKSPAECALPGTAP